MGQGCAYPFPSKLQPERRPSIGVVAQDTKITLSSGDNGPTRTATRTVARHLRCRLRTDRPDHDNPSLGAGRDQELRQDAEIVVDGVNQIGLWTFLRPRNRGLPYLAMIELVTPPLGWDDPPGQAQWPTV
jgi:hypothetical protein